MRALIVLTLLLLSADASAQPAAEAATIKIEGADSPTPSAKVERPEEIVLPAVVVDREEDQSDPEGGNAQQPQEMASQPSQKSGPEQQHEAKQRPRPPAAVTDAKRAVAEAKRIERKAARIERLLKASRRSVKSMKSLMRPIRGRR